MKIEYCLFACNNNEKYYRYYEYVREFWIKVLGVKTKLIFIGETIPERLQKFSDEIILFNLEGIHPVFIAQNIRLLYPALLNSTDGVIIADIDILPLNSKYFLEDIKEIDNETFIFINTTGKEIQNEYYICYNIATSKKYGELFEIETIEDIRNKLKDWYSKIEYTYNDKYRSLCKGFHHDQLILKKYLDLKKINLKILNKRPSRLATHKYGFNNKTIENKIIIDKILKDLRNFDDYHISKELNFNNRLHEKIKDIILNI